MNLRKCLRVAGLALVVLAFPLSATAQIVTYVGSSSGGTMPGSPTDFIFFNTSTFPSTVSATNRNTNPNSPSSVLTSFSFIGGIVAVNGTASYSTIVTPAGTSLLTGDIQANGTAGTFTASMAFEPGTAGSKTADANFNPAFNYNNFNVYVMYSNTGNSRTDTAVTFSGSSLAHGTPVGTPTTVLLNGIAAPLDNNTTKTTARYLEFNVSGLATALQSDNSIVFTLSANHTGSLGYFGAASFVSIADVPEPATWATLLGGIGALLVVQRVRRKFNG